ncbi:MAG: glycosyltransferase [Chloroflexi bacterium]|nr:glycosyltransferase [Chloroflexota bacterium]
MRIGIIAPFHDFGGSEHQILLLLRGLQQRGVEFVFFHLNIRSPELLEELESIPDCNHVEIRLRSVKKIFYFVQDMQNIAKQLRKSECELLHCWNYTGHIIGGVVSKFTRVPCIYSIGGLDPWKKNWQLPFYRLLNWLADVFVFQSDIERDAVSRKEWIPLKRTMIIPNGMDHTRFHPANRDEVREEIRKEMSLHLSLPLILSVGSLRRIKGHDVLIEAVRRICEAQPDLPFQVLIVGDGPLREAYEQSSRGLPITFSGFRKDVERFYLAADLYCQPSRSEGLPNAVIEALGCGLPVIASEVGGISALVTAENGLLCKSEDPESLAKQVYSLLLLPETWPIKALASRRVSEGFSTDRMLNSYIALYNSVYLANKTN